MRVSVREREKVGTWIGTGSAQIDINQTMEPKYRAWVQERTTRTSKPLYFEEAVYGGAEAIGISPITARRYLSKMTSPQGGFLLIVHIVDGRPRKEIVYKRSLLK